MFALPSNANVQPMQTRLQQQPDVLPLLPQRLKQFFSEEWGQQVEKLPFATVTVVNNGAMGAEFPWLAAELPIQTFGASPWARRGNGAHDVVRLLVDDGDGVEVVGGRLEGFAQLQLLLRVDDARLRQSRQLAMVRWLRVRHGAADLLSTRFGCTRLEWQRDQAGLPMYAIVNVSSFIRVEHLMPDGAERVPAGVPASQFYLNNFKWL